MGNAQPQGLFGYAGQPIVYTLADGSQLPAGDLVARAFEEYHRANPMLSVETAEANWNKMTEGFRQAACQDELQAINDAQKAGAAAVDATAALSVDAQVAGQLGAALIDAALSEVKILARPWQQMTADQQSEVLERITRQVKEATAATIRLIQTMGRAHIVCELESITVKKGAKAVLEIPKGELDQDLLDSVGASVILVIGPALSAAQDIQAPKPDPDQPDLLGNSLGNGDNGLVTHSDPED